MSVCDCAISHQRKGEDFLKRKGKKKKICPKAAGGPKSCRGREVSCVSLRSFPLSIIHKKELFFTFAKKKKKRCHHHRSLSEREEEEEEQTEEEDIRT